jgi:hypothetical protein
MFKYVQVEKESSKAAAAAAAAAAEAADARGKKPRKKASTNNKTAPSSNTNTEDLSAAQKLANEQMRRVLEEDQYSANGSIVETDSECE